MQSFLEKGMGFSEDLESLVIKSHATNQVKIASERVEIDSFNYKEKELLFLKVRQFVV